VLGDDGGEHAADTVVVQLLAGAMQGFGREIVLIEIIQFELRGDLVRSGCDELHHSARGGD